MNSLLQTYSGSFAPLKIRNFRIYLGGQAISLLGTWMQVTAQSWVVWELTGSASALGIVVMLNTLPLFLLAPWAGSIADRYNRRMILLVTQTIAMLLAFTLAILVQTNLVQIWHIFILAFLLGTVNVLDFPAQQAFIGDLSGMDQVRRAATLNIMALQLARMIGPAIAGLVIKWGGTAFAFWVNGASFSVVLLSLFFVRSHQATNQARSTGHDFQDALRYVRSQPRMMDLMIFATLVTFFGLSIMNILPALADHVLKGDSQTYGLLLGSSGAGALVSTLVLLPLSQAYKRIGLIVSGAALWMGAAFLVLSRLSFLPFSMAAIFCVSLSAPLVLTTGLGVLQLMTPATMRARVISLFTMITFGLQPFASIFIGFSAEKFGTPTAILINSLSLLVGATVMLVLRKDLRVWELGAHPATQTLEQAAVD